MIFRLNQNMLKLKKSQYLNSMLQLNYMKCDKTLLYKIVYYKQIENRIFKFLTIICEIQKKRKNAKLLASIRSTNFV